MLLTIKTTHNPATDLGFLLHKNPEKLHSFELSVGRAHVFFPENTRESCSATLLLDIDPIALVKKKRYLGEDSFVLEEYVNDRPYVASSFLSMGIARVFKDGLKGVCKEKPELLEEPWPFEVSIPAVPCRESQGKDFISSLFAPLGYQVTIKQLPLSEKNPDWGEASIYSVTLSNTCFLKDLLSHLYVLIPVLDNQKHYWVDEEEIEKLLSHGKKWLSTHPEKNQIVLRYLKHQKDLTKSALAELRKEGGETSEDIPSAREETISLQKERMLTVVNVLKEHSIHSVIDLGCGEGDLIQELLKDPSFHLILGVDVSRRELERAQKKLRLDDLLSFQRKRVELIQGSLTYVDARFQGFDAATLIEVIEHLDPARLSMLEYVVFGKAKPSLIIITTPNAEYNPLFEESEKKFRHTDHRFEWTRNEFKTWAETVSLRYGYSVSFREIGLSDALLGSPTQMGIFVQNSQGAIFQ